MTHVQCNSRPPIKRRPTRHPYSPFLLLSRDRSAEGWRRAPSQTRMKPFLIFAESGHGGRDDPGDSRASNATAYVRPGRTLLAAPPFARPSTREAPNGSSGSVLFRLEGY